MATCPKCGTRFPSTVRFCTHDGTVLDDEPTQDPQLGKLLDGKYRLDGFLSQGGMGAVYKATHVMLDKVIAVKLIKPELVTSAEIVRRFQREARAASNLNHPNIIGVYDLGQTDDGTLYIAMEYIDGPSLKELIRTTGPLPVDRIVAILTKVSSALALAHSHNIIHRDLKPHNIMLARGAGGQEVPKLLDFGIAKTFDEAGTQLTQTGFAIGTPQYMAPEQAAGKEVTAQSDLYSLGVILYEMLTGEVPFDAPSTAGILIKQLTEDPLPPSRRKPEARVSPVLEAVALRCLDKEPSRRYSTADEFAAALQGAAEPGADQRQGEAATRVFPAPAGGTTPPSRTATTAGAIAPPAVTAGTTRQPSPAPAMPTRTPMVPPSPAVAAALPPTAIVPPASAPAPAIAAAAQSSGGTRPTVPAAIPPLAVAAPPPPQPPAASSKTGLWITLGAVALLVAAVGAIQFGLVGGQPSAPASVASNAPSPQSAPSPAPAASPAAADTPSSPAARTPDTTPATSALPPPPAPAATPVTAEKPPQNSATPAAAPASNPVPVTGGAREPRPTAPAATGAAASTPPAARPSAPTPPRPPSPAAAPERPAPSAPSRPAPSPAPVAAASAAPAAAQAARPENPAVMFRCEGFPMVCNALRASLLETFQKHNIQPVNNQARAAIVVTGNVDVVQERVSREFGQVMQTRTYTVDVSGESKDGSPISMPPPRTFSFDAQFGRDRLDENAKLIANDVAEKIRAYWNK